MRPSCSPLKCRLKPGTANARGAIWKYPLVSALHPASPFTTGNAARCRPGGISGRQNSVRDRFAFPPKPPPHRLGIGPIRSVRTSAGGKSVLANPALHRPLPCPHGTANGVQPHQYKRHGPRSVPPPPGQAPPHGRMMRTGLPSPRPGILLAHVHGPRFTAPADAAGRPRHLRNMPVHKPLLRLLRPLHAFFLPVSRRVRHG